MTLNVRIDRGESSWGVSANDPSICGSVSAVGGTKEEAVDQFRSALEFHLDGLRDDGFAVPKFKDLQFELSPMSSEDAINRQVDGKFISNKVAVALQTLRNSGAKNTSVEPGIVTVQTIKAEEAELVEE